MATATAIQPRLPEVDTVPVTLDLVLAQPEDFKYIATWQENFRSRKPVYKLRVGMIYFIKSQRTNKIDAIPYQLTTETDLDALNEYLNQNMVYVARYPFNNL